MRVGDESARARAEAIDPTAPGDDWWRLGLAARVPGWRQTARRFTRHRPAMVGAVVLVLMVLACFVGARFAPDPDLQVLTEKTAGPSAAHWFGTDLLSRDLLARVLHGGQISLQIALGVAVFSTLIGVFVGVVAGFRGGWVDGLLMRFTDLWIALPALPFLAVANSIGTVDLGPLGSLDLGGPLGMAVMLSLLLWCSIARVVRGTTLELRERDFVAAARAMGLSNRRIVVRHILPNSVGPIVVNATLVVAEAILIESTLSFLGFGIQPPTASWGNLLTDAIGNLDTTWWLVVFPGAFIFLTVLAVNFVGDGLRDALDPRRESRA